MDYKIISTKEMNILLDNCVNYLLFKIKNEKAAKHLLDGILDIYHSLERNPKTYPYSEDQYLKALGYHVAKVSGMNYILIYKIDGINVYILGIFHTLENYTHKIKSLFGNNLV